MTNAFEDALQSLLVGHAGLAALVGDRIWPEAIPSQIEVVYPCIVRICEYRGNQLLEAEPGTCEMRLELWVYADDPAHRLAINRQLLDCLYGPDKTLGDIKARGLTFESYDSGQWEKSPGQLLYGAIVAYTGILDLSDLA